MLAKFTATLDVARSRTVSPVLRIRSLVVTITALGFAPTLNAQGSFTLDQVMSSPFPSGLVAAPAGGSVAWVQNALGWRNIWIAEAPDYVGRQLTMYDTDDGQEISSLRFTPDASKLVYVRGGGPNRQGEIPNPVSSPSEAQRAIWLVPTAGGEPRKLAEGSAPIVSPAGDKVLFLRRGQVWSVALSGDGSPEEFFHIRGSAESLSWSPDGSMLAFVSDRGDHSFIGVYDVERDTLRYLDPSVDRDANPVWSPNGDRIAFTRFPQTSGFLPFMARREGLPWSIRVADVTSGIGHVVWEADEGDGSVFRGVVASSQLFWGDNDHLVFPWERDGWTHLYSVPVSGGPAVLLTPGEFEVEQVVLSPDRSELIFSSNQDDIDRRHLWRVGVSGGTPRAITTGSGIEWAPAVTADGEAIAMLNSDARNPARAGIKIGSSDVRALAPGSLPEDFPVGVMVEPQQVVFSGADGLRIHGQLFLPPNMRRGDRYPAIMFFHGGSRRQMLLGWHYLGYYHNAYAMNQYMASRGYIVLAVNYRSGIGYGMEFREALNYGARGASEFNDVLGGGLYLRSRPDVDPNRIGLWGGSYGGYLTALGLARASDLFAAGVDLHGVHDWNMVIRNFRPSYNPAEAADVARLAYESSPMASVKDWRSPVLLIHADDDRNVPFSESVDLTEQLRKHGVYFEQLIFPDDVHGFLLHRNWVAAYRAAADFFDRMLMGVEGATGGK
jgi:dipeptidyl aminopeptidase/acylaminoacyl peptidase